MLHTPGRREASVVRPPAGAPPIETPRATVFREHLVAKLDRVASARLRLVVAPAGSGKTVLLRQLAATTRRSGQVAVWCTANAAEVSATSFVRKLASCFGNTLGRDPGRIGHIDAMLSALVDAESEIVVYLDDAHRLLGRPSADALTQLLEDAPPHVRFVVASRHERVPATGGLDGDNSTYRIGYDNSTYRIGYDELKFRTWDVEQLFRDVYRSPLSPESAATLCAQVEGLPIALRLLHLDTALMSAQERDAAALSPLAHSGRIREFLADEILGPPLPTEVRDFMVDASVVGVLDGTLCDTVLDCQGSGALLDRLAENNLLTFRSNPGHSLRFHVLLQQFLEQRFAELRGPHLTRQAYHHAAVELMSAGHWAEAYRCYAHAEDWVATAGLLHRFSAHHGGLYASASVPSTLLDNDGWIALADARRLRGEGRFAQAYDRYLFAEDRLPEPRLRWQCSLERSIIARWITGDDSTRDADPLVDDVSGYLLEAVRRQPTKLLTRSVPSASPGWTLGRVLAAMLDGRSELAVELAEPLTTCANTFVALASKIVIAALDAIVYSRGTSARFAALAVEAEAAGWLWLARIARAAAALVEVDGCADAVAVLDDCRDIGDEWGALLIGYLLAVGRLRDGQDATGVLAEAVERARRLDAAVVETWMQILLISELDRCEDPNTAAERTRLDDLLGDVRLSRVSADGAELLALIRTPVNARPSLTLAEQPVEPDPPVAIRCFGRYELLVEGKEIDLAALRAQARRVLRVLSMYYGQPLHEERLVTALWPDVPLKQSKHRLHVAISSLRTMLRKHLPDGHHGIIRHGNAYLLRLPAGSTVDVVEFADALDQWRHRRDSRDRAAVTTLGHRVLDLYRGELLSEEGPVEWVLARREAVRGEAAGVAATLARIELERGNIASAIDVCERALRIDELDNQLWTLLADAKRRAGNVAAARRTQQAYQDLLAGG